MSKGRARFTYSATFQRDLYRLPGTREALLLAVARIEAYGKGDAPRRGPRTSWNSIRNQIGSTVAMDRGGWFGGVFTEANDRARHAMLQEMGFTSPSGRRIPGRHWLKGALLKARIE
ncbi:hypothetical protein [Streptomyces misionensis]|uniref:hypothetical protein n=1 Tax=Streptomyces misionensis TaxID=67331 RepID=UPI0036AC051A